MVPAAVDLAILVEVDEIHQQFLTHAADKAIRVPTFCMTRPGSKNDNVPSIYLTTTLQGEKERGGREREGKGPSRGGGKGRERNYKL